MSKNIMPCQSIQLRVVEPMEYIRVITGHTNPKDFNDEDSDLALERESALMEYRKYLASELALTDRWIDNCRAIQAQAMENAEGER